MNPFPANSLPVKNVHRDWNLQWQGIFFSLELKECFAFVMQGSPGGSGAKGDSGEPGPQVRVFLTVKHVIPKGANSRSVAANRNLSPEGGNSIGRKLEVAKS